MKPRDAVLPWIYLLCFLISFSGCTVYHPLRRTALPAELPEFYRNYYDYPKIDFRPELLMEESKPDYVLRRFEFSVSFPAELTPRNLEKLRSETEELFKTDQKNANDQKLRYLNRVDLYFPEKMKPGEKRPVILISPILGGNMVVDRFARYYAGRGYIAALVYRKKPFLQDEGGSYAEQLEDYLRLSVIKLRQVVDWLETVPEADTARLGAFGVSYGAILHSVLAAVEPRIRYHVLAMPAGPLPEVIVACPDKLITKLHKQVKEKYGLTDEAIFQELKGKIKTDPIYLAPYVPKSKVQIYIALFDRVVGAKRSWGLWKSFGKPQVKVMPFGHYGGVLIFPYLQTRSYLSFKHHLKN